MDPNFEEHLGDFLKRGKGERPDYELPSDLRMLKYKNMAEVKKIAAKELKKAGAENIALAEEVIFVWVNSYQYILIVS